MHQAITQDACILVCGVGSIGERHIQNLLNLGYHNIILHRKRNLPLRTLKQNFPVYTTLDEALEHEPEITFITSPTHQHLETAIQCAKAHSHLFIEKPISHNTKNVGTLSTIVNNNNTKVMVGYMMRFHPCLQKIKYWLEQQSIGDPIYLHTQWGEYLPDWHPWEDYRQSYAARVEMGGGPALTLSHEIDTVQWLFGTPNHQVSLSNRKSHLEIDTEHGIDILLRFPAGETAHIHLDYFQKPPKRTLEIVGTTGKIHFDYYKGCATRWASSGDIEETIDVSQTFDRNQLFTDEVEYFLTCLNKDIMPQPSIKDALASVQIAQEAILKG